MKKSERGQALILVLLLLLVGCLLIPAMLAFVSTALKSGRIYEQRMLELYAADGGIEDGIYKIMCREIPPETEQPYRLTLNGKDVLVSISQQRTSMIEFFEMLGALDPGGQGNYKKADPHQLWMVVYTPLQSESGVWDTYKIEVTYTGSGTAKLENVGCWIRGLYDAGGKAAQVTGVEPGSISLAYPDCDFSARVFQGTSFQWHWHPGKGPIFRKGDTMSQVFTFSPTITSERFPLNVAWVAPSRNDIFISWTGECSGIYQVTATAESPDSGKSTTIDCHLGAEETQPGMPPVVTILTWETTSQ